MSDRMVLQHVLGINGDYRNEDGEYSWSTLSLFDRAIREGKETVPDPLHPWSKVTHLHYRHMKGGSSGPSVGPGTPCTRRAGVCR